MNIYFVRHAESEGNAGGIEHHDEVGLTDHGRKQAELLAKRFTNIPIDIIISSTYIRTRQTSDIINEVIGKEIIYNDTLTERLMPTAVLGKVSKHEEVQSVYQLLQDNLKKPNARHSDEENFEDLKERARKALDFIKNQPYENILVVSHGAFLRVLLAYMTFGEELTGHELAQIHRTFRSKNTGISFVEHEIPKSPLKNEWIIRAWNDHAHLGEIDRQHKQSEIV